QDAARLDVLDERRPLDRALHPAVAAHHAGIPESRGALGPDGRGAERVGTRGRALRAQEDRPLLLRQVAPSRRAGPAMTDADLYRLWYVWLTIGGAIVVVAAVLLVTIWLTARGIEREALRALRAVERIRESTHPIWHLDDTNRVAEGLAVA